MADQKTVFLFDVDNTLVDNDHVISDLRRHLESDIGHDSAQRYWTLFEELRSELGYADYLGALQRCRLEHPRDFNILAVSSYLLNYPFANRLYPNSLDVVDRCQAFGETVIVTDGDVVFQPFKINRSGLYEAFEGKVLIYIHKEMELEDITTRYPADHYVFIDDKVRILSAVKKAWGPRATTIFPRQGHYAADEKELEKFPKPDFTIDRIGALVEADLPGIIKSA
jgi:FMN phosphatase YigB (HAD superfamily)